MDDVIEIDLATATIAELQQRLASGRLSSERLTGLYLDRITAVNSRGPGLHAVAALVPDVLQQARRADADRAAGRVRGPLHGIPVLVKDNIDVAGVPTTAGSVALATSMPDVDAPVVAALRRAGVVVLGKTTLTEMANFTTKGMPSGYSSLGGQVLNPYDASRTPSGSSAGSAVAAAAALAAATVGTETSGSILSPAQACSVVGVKPTVGLVSRTGIVPISATQDTAGPMARHVADAAALLGAMTGVDPEDPATAASAPHARTDYLSLLGTAALRGARLGVVADEDPVFTAALDVLRERGAVLVPVEVGDTGAPSILTRELRRDLEAYLARLPAGAPLRTLGELVDHYSANAREALKFGQTLLEASLAVDLGDPATAAAYEVDRERGVTESRAAIDSVLGAHDLVAIVSASATTGVGARAGYPSVSVPAGYSAVGREPVSLVLLGTAWSEGALLALADDYERAARVWRPPTEVNPGLFRWTALGSDPDGAGPP
ncbi:amidase family protein [Rhodococcus antarcticus]|uniref:Amidase family protein n=1 Tax=Rhodococcus antarcticus TaxID=2987751 RepID=A0ABY6P557_9NOCA|nr:amidase family protein [Rhodococcus antarcticus]UZJ26293.1 amidase family protein [Rhodococcus antarcticus]